jgi:4a-hydroxytetrahydrobiopterin dehydratase
MVLESLQSVSEWAFSPETEGGSLSRTFAFASFRDAQAFVNQVADLAEEQQHHPEVIWSYRRVCFTLTTHDASGLTEKDTRLALAINAINAPMTP